MNSQMQIDVLCTLTFNLHQRLLDNEREQSEGIWYELKEPLITAKQTSMISSSAADVSSSSECKKEGIECKTSDKLLQMHHIVLNTVLVCPLLPDVNSTQMSGMKHDESVADGMQGKINVKYDNMQSISWSASYNLPRLV